MDVTSAVQATLVHSPHPLLAGADRRFYYAAFLPGETIEAYLDRQGIVLGAQPVVLAINGVPVPREYWRHVRPKPGTLITIRATVHGGGGKKNPLGTILSIALMVVAPQFGAWAATNIYGQSMLAFGTFTWAQVWGGVFSMAGNLLIGSLTSPPKPNLSEVNGRYRAEQTSPTYALTGGANRPRFFEPLPLLIGRHRFFPDAGSKPYTEFAGDDQYLYAIFNFGLSDMDLEDWKIGDTSLTTYDDIEVFTSGEDGKIAEFPGNVDSIAGGNLVEADGWITRTSSLNSVALAIDVQGMLFWAGDAGITNRSCVCEFEYRKVGDSTWLPFVPTGWTQSDYYWSKGAYTIDGTGASVWRQSGYGSITFSDHTEGESAGTGLVWHWRPFSEITNADGTYKEPAPKRKIAVKASQVTFTNGSRKPLRVSFRIDVPVGQYEVRGRRVTADETNSRATSDLSWSTLRSYQQNNADYTGQRRVGVKVRASGQLNGNIEQFNCVASSKAPIWVPASSAWGYGRTSNPAWLFLWFARGKFDANGKRLYGAGLPDAKIDIEAIKAWGAWCVSKGLTFNAVIDSRRSCAEVLEMIARCGRASCTWATGRLGVVWDQAGLPIAAVFGMASMMKGGFRVDYVTEKLPEEIVVRFRNPDLNWQEDSVRANVPGVTNPERSVTLELFGCTDTVMAGKEALLMAASQVLHRRRITWQCDSEGLVSQRGDVVVISHDLTNWGYSGRLVATTASQLTLDRKVSYASGTPYVGVRKPDGTYEIRQVQAFTGEQDVLTLTSPLSFNPSADTNNPVVDYTWLFDPKETPGRKVKIIGVPRPIARGRMVEFLAIDELDEYYNAENGTYTYVPPVSTAQPLPQIVDLDVTEEWVLVGNSYATKLVVTWDVIGSYDHAAVRYAYGTEAYQLLPTTTGRRAEILIHDSGDVRIEVSILNAIGQLDPVNGVASITHTIGGKDFAVSDVLGFTAQDARGLVLFRWSQVADPDLAGYEIRFNPLGEESWADAATVTKTTRGTQVTTGIVPPGEWTFLIKARDAAGNVSVNAAVASCSVANPNTVIVQRVEQDFWEMGTRTNCIIHEPTRTLVPRSSLDAEDAGWSVFDEFCTSAYSSCEYAAPELDLGSDGHARLYAVLLSHLGPGETGISDPDAELDHRLEAGSYDGYEPWDVGYADLRRFKMKIVFDNAEGKAVVTGFWPTADAEPRTDTGSATVAVGGSTIVFPSRFFTTPVVSPTLIGTTAGSVSISAVTPVQCVAQVFDASGADVGGQIMFTADGV